jgi:hypothetical protein
MDSDPPSVRHTPVYQKVGMHRIPVSGRPDNPAFFDIRYTAGCQIALPFIRLDIRLMFS